MKNHKIIWMNSAIIDLNIIADYIVLDSSKIAIKTTQKIKSATANLKKFPNHGKIVSELKKYGVYDFYEIVISPWRIIYKTSKTDIFIFAIIDSRRDFEDILFDRFINKF